MAVYYCILENKPPQQSGPCLVLNLGGGGGGGGEGGGIFKRIQYNNKY